MRDNSVQKSKHRLCHVLTRCLLIFGSLALTNMHAHASKKIFVCEDVSGHKVFTDLGCPASKRYQPPDTPTVEFAPLDHTETKQLEALNKRADKEAIVRRKYAQRHRRQQTKQADLRNASCRQATQALEQLTDQRRKGYALAEQSALNQRQASLKARKRQDCS